MDHENMRYERPQTARRAAELLSMEPGVARILAGGTDVMVQLRSGVVEPDLMIDIKHIAGLRDIVPEAGGFRVGAAVSGAELGEHAGVRALWPGVVEGAELIGSTQIQGRATMAGNLCNGSPAADAVPGLLTAGAIARIAGPDGERDCPVEEIPVGPGKTSLAKGEFVMSFLLPARPERSGDAYLRFIPRTEMDIAVCSAAVSLTLGADGKVAEARVALGAVAPTVRLVETAAASIVGTALDDGALAELQAACSAACAPIDDKRGTIAFRTKVAGVLAKRAALIAFERAGGRK
jgi:carbon-monoxide dehydrogenase medium subunit